MKNVLKPLARSILILLGLTAASTADMQKFIKKILGSRHSLDLAPQRITATFIISNDFNLSSRTATQKY